MINKTFKAFLVYEEADGSFRQTFSHRSFDDLPDNDVLINVKYTSLNYKDALSATGHKGVTKAYPHTPGIDAAGLVASSRDKRYKPGDEVIVTGFDLGMNTPGGFAEYISVPAEWIIILPKGLSLSESMMLGTAGFTAAYAVYKLKECGQKPDHGPILITGATGGVGSLAIPILAKMGYEIIASTGKSEEADYLKQLGASVIIDRNEVDDSSGKPLMRPKWAGAIDTVGGNVLATTLKACKKHGNVAAMGNVLSSELHTTVFPFILNGINLLGIDSATCPMSVRKHLWHLMSDEWKPENLNRIAKTIKADELKSSITRILNGNVKGRLLIDTVNF